MTKFKKIVILGFSLLFAGTLTACATTPKTELPSKDFSVTINDSTYSIPFKVNDLINNDVTIYTDANGTDLYTVNETFYNIQAQAKNQDLFTIDVKTGSTAEEQGDNAMVVGLHLQSYDNNLNTAKIGGSLLLNQSTIADVTAKYGKDYVVQQGNIDKPDKDVIIITYTMEGKLLTFYFFEGKISGFEIVIND